MTGLSVTNDILPLLSGEAGVYVSGGAPAKGALLLLPKDAAAGRGIAEEDHGGGHEGGRRPEAADVRARCPSGEGQIATVDGHDVSWLHDGDLIAIGFDTGGVRAGRRPRRQRRVPQRPATRRSCPTRSARLLYADVPGLVDLAQRTGGDQVPADALANIQALGGAARLVDAGRRRRQERALRAGSSSTAASAFQQRSLVHSSGQSRPKGPVSACAISSSVPSR